jgi:hypothetical protein
VCERSTRAVLRWHRDSTARHAEAKETVPVDGGDAASAGLEVIILDHQGRITADHQFIET